MTTKLLDVSGSTDEGFNNVSFEAVTLIKHLVILVRSLRASDVMTAPRCRVFEVFYRTSSELSHL